MSNTLTYKKAGVDIDKVYALGMDLVSMCVNDILPRGAEPLFFLDYFATGKLKADKAADVIKGIVKGCKEAGCSLIGGETAEMPGFYSEGEYDLSGFAVGVVNKEKIIDGSQIKEGDVIIGIASNGLHSNGYSLVRKVFFDSKKMKIDDYIPDLGTTLGEELLKPTKIYVKAFMALKEDMKKTFNMGICYVMVISANKAKDTISILNKSGYSAFIIGNTEKGGRGVRYS